ncbi:hypothetical protein N665_0156s0008 [Sinapis alba]|nr:hypothetical protein N665_0156s0008 [Sinapis alba]
MERETETMGGEDLHLELASKILLEGVSSECTVKVEGVLMGIQFASTVLAKKQQDGDQAEASTDIVNKAASIAIPIPHVGSTHATVNRIWAVPKGVVVNVWSPESALSPPDLFSIPMSVDLRGVPNNLYSHKGLRCLSKTTFKFVKLHPNTEKCVHLDVVRVLVESWWKRFFRDKDGHTREIEVTFPWLPSRSNVCKRWRHKGQDCSNKEFKILNKETDKVTTSTFVDVPQPGGEAVSLEGNAIESLLQDLEDLTPKPSSHKISKLAATDKNTDHRKVDTVQKKYFGTGDFQAIQLSEPTTKDI